MTVTVHTAQLAEIDPATLYAILALRVDVFVVEQKCAYRELDGRDLEPTARQLWAEQDGTIIATLRLLIDSDGRARIGRVATARPARSAGAAGALMRAALDLVAGTEIVLEAQLPLEGWYERFGFAREGRNYTEDGIDHVTMRRSANG